MKRPLIGTIAVLSGLVIAATGCAAKEGGGGPKGEIPIGINIERSGSASVQGEAYRKALDLMVADINKKGVLGKAVKPYYVDNKSDPAESLTATKSLVQNHHIVALVGAGASPTTMSVVDYLDQAHIPAVSMGSSGAIVKDPKTGTSRPYLFKTPADTKQMVDVVAADWAQRGIHRIGVLTVNNAYGDAGLAGVTARATQDHLDVVDKEKFDPAEKDLTIEVRKIVQANPDAVWVSAIPPGAGLAAQAFKQLGYGGKVYFDAGAGAELFINGAGKAAEGMYMVHPKILAANQLTATTPAVITQKQWFKEYSQKYGNYSGFASYAADALKLIVLAIGKAHSTKPEKIRDALESLTYDGLTGTYQMTPTNHTGLQSSALTIFTVRDSSWVLAR
jgi:branched-chain amino acid transport system substrate-binding protein